MNLHHNQHAKIRMRLRLGGAESIRDGGLRPGSQNALILLTKEEVIRRKQLRIISFSFDRAQEMRKKKNT